MTKIIPTPEVLDKEARIQREIAERNNIPKEQASPPISRDLIVQAIPFRAPTGILQPYRIGTARVIIVITSGGSSVDRTVQFGPSGTPFPVLDSILQLKVPYGVDQIILRSPTSDWIGTLLVSPDPKFEYDSQALTWPPVSPGSNPGVVTITGNAILRYFSPAVLGINAAPPAVLASGPGYGNRGFLSNVIDLTAMRSINVQVMRRVDAVGGSESVPVGNIFLEMAFDPPGLNQFPTTHDSAGSIRDQSLVKIDTFQFDADAAGFPVFQVANRGRAFDVAQGAGSANNSGLYGPLGASCRLWLDWNTAAIPASQFWYASIWASS